MTSGHRFASFVLHPAPDPAAPDPPARVGRLAIVQGTVQYRPAPDADWAPAGINLPLTSGHAVFTEPQARALLELPEGRIALESASRVEFLRLDDEALQLTLAEGQLALDLRSLPPGEMVQIVTPRGTASINAPGRYLVTAGAEDRPTRIAVHAGAARVTAEGLDQPLKVGEAVALTGTWPPQAQMERAGAPAPILAWAAALDVRGTLPLAARGMTGAEDTLRYGRWDSHPDYGQVWYPPVQAGWAPYRHGRWAWVAPWGWTWVDDAPWGYAPFHYGRWFYGSYGWGWAPRPYYYAGLPWRRPIWAPALVSFWGGFHWGFGHGWGRPIAWAPLGPGEFYRPWYRGSPLYARNLNLAHVRGLAAGGPFTTPSPNRLMNHAHATAAPINALTSGAPIGRMGQAFQPSMLAGAQPIAGHPALPAAGQRGGVAGAPNLGAGSGSTGRQAFGPGPGPGARPPLPAAGGRTAVAALAMPRVVTPSGVTGGAAPGFSGRGVPPAFNGGGAAPGFTGRGAPPAFQGGGGQGFSGRAAAPAYQGGGGAPRFAAPSGGYQGGYARAPSGGGYQGGGYARAPAASFAPRGGGGGFSAPSASRAAVSAPRASGGGGHGGGGRRR